MQLNRTTEYALTILGFMATRDEALYSAELLHQELNIPRRYLRRILTDLSKYGFLTSLKGRNGGFTFAKDLKKINFADVITAMEGTEILNRCLIGFTCCIVDKPCVMHDAWIEASTKMKEVLANTNLADLKEKYNSVQNTNPINQIN
jgi:Rrf2 family transcriptional regulator, iron-sulfur cluster assembly transcription factor